MGPRTEFRAQADQLRANAAEQANPNVGQALRNIADQWDQLAEAQARVDLAKKARPRKRKPVK